MKKILVVTTRFPFDLSGAAEQDIVQGIVYLRKLGYEVWVMTSVYARHLEVVSKTEEQYGIHIIPVLYSFETDTKNERLFRSLKRLINPAFWDGAAFEYRGKKIQATMHDVLREFNPDLVWFDYTYLWPLYHQVKERGVPIVTRSMNYEPQHFLGKTKRNIFDLMRYWSKVQTEKRTLAMTDLFFTITPKEKILYETINKNTKIVNLPLRRLPIFIGKNSLVHEREHLNIFFSGSNYMVHHMIEGLQFILEHINPLLQRQYPGKFTLHVIGSRVPEWIASKKYENVVFHGYVPDLDEFLKDMDIALSPTLSGWGMQQKVFEPIVRGIPTVTSDRALFGYPLYDDVHVLTGNHKDPQSYVDALGTLIDSKQRECISHNAVKLALELFSEKCVLGIIDWNIKKLIH